MDFETEYVDISRTLARIEQAQAEQQITLEAMKGQRVAIDGALQEVAEITSKVIDFLEHHLHEFHDDLARVDIAFGKRLNQTESRLRQLEVKLNH
jgi:hypothetical protein